MASSREHLLVRWVEGGRRHCNEQRWRRGAAVRAGHCAVSGLPIHAGEAVYRPPGELSAEWLAPMIAVRAVFSPD